MGSYWVAHKVQSGISVYSGHIVVSLPGCTQLLSMFVWEKKCFDHHWVAGWDFFFFFCSGNVSFTGLSNSVLVGCFNFQRSVGCTTSSYLLLRPRLHLISCSHSCSSPLVPPHRREGAQKFKWLCNKETGADVWTAGERKYLLCCSVPRALFLRHTKCGGEKRLL